MKLHDELILLVSLVVVVLSSCAHTISGETRELIDKDISPEAILKNPDEYIGKTVLIGGFIAETVNTEGGSYIEVVQNPLDYRGVPADRDISYGRFLIFHEAFLDTSIFLPGRDLVVAGEVKGTEVRPLGEIQYSYPLIKSRELRLVTPGSKIRLHFGFGVFHSF
jgi:outer membrane lipoprotein